MKSKTVSFFWILMLISLLIIMPGFTGMAFGQGKQTETLRFSRERIERLRQAAQSLLELAKQPPPPNLPPSEQNEADRYSIWLKLSSQKLSELASRWYDDLAKIEKSKIGDLKTRIGLSREVNQSYIKEYLQLLNKLTDENRRFTTVSNIMKTKHDTAKNAINNVR
jgi:hypothetical protein